MLQAMSQRVPFGHPTGWDFRDVGDDFTGNNVDPVRLRAGLVCWADDGHSDVEFEDFADVGGEGENVEGDPRDLTD